MPCVAEVVNRSLKADCTDFTCHLRDSVTASECEKTLQNNIHQDTHSDDGHGGDLHDLSYLLCILI